MQCAPAPAPAPVTAVANWLNEKGSLRTLLSDYLTESTVLRTLSGLFLCEGTLTDLGPPSPLLPTLPVPQTPHHATPQTTVGNPTQRYRYEMSAARPSFGTP